MLIDEVDLISEAKMVLDFNWTGQYTRPGPRLYPHQWSWDSALIAIGYSSYDQERATSELTHLLDALTCEEHAHRLGVEAKGHVGCLAPGVPSYRDARDDVGVSVSVQVQSAKRTEKYGVGLP